MRRSLKARSSSSTAAAWALRTSRSSAPRSKARQSGALPSVSPSAAQPWPRYYTSATQVAALLPSNTPTGNGTITVTYNNQPSNSAPITMVTRNLGIFTVDSSGGGPGIVTYADYSLVSPTKAANCGGPNTTCGAANPGDTLILWATGFGP